MEWAYPGWLGLPRRTVGCYFFLPRPNRLATPQGSPLGPLILSKEKIPLPPSTNKLSWRVDGRHIKGTPLKCHPIIKARVWASKTQLQHFCGSPNGRGLPAKIPKSLSGAGFWNSSRRWRCHKFLLQNLLFTILPQNLFFTCTGPAWEWVSPKTWPKLTFLFHFQINGWVPLFGKGGSRVQACCAASQISRNTTLPGFRDANFGVGFREIQLLAKFAKLPLKSTSLDSDNLNNNWDRTI